MHNEQDLKNTPEYRSGMFRIVTCPVCGYPTLDMYWICEHCGWEYDIELQTEDEESPCNGMSLRAYRELYKTGGISMNVTICSRKAAEELLRTDTLSRTAVISFCDPPSVGKPVPTPPLDYAGKAARVFTVVVHDLDLTALPDVGLDYDTYMPEAGRAGGVYLSGKGGRAGYPFASASTGRAAAPAAPLPQFWSISTAPAFPSLPNYRYYPNQVVYHKIMDALTRYGPETQSST